MLFCEPLPMFSLQCGACKTKMIQNIEMITPLYTSSHACYIRLHISQILYLPSKVQEQTSWSRMPVRHTLCSKNYDVTDNTNRVTWCGIGGSVYTTF